MISIKQQTTTKITKLKFIPYNKVPEHSEKKKFIFYYIMLLSVDVFFIVLKY